MHGGSERSGDGVLPGLSWPWRGFRRLSSESGDEPAAMNGPTQMQNGHVQNGMPSSIEATARLASKGPHLELTPSACVCFGVPLFHDM